MIAGMGFYLLSFGVLILLLICTSMDFKTNITINKIMLAIIITCMLRMIILFVSIVYGTGEASSRVISLFDNSVVLAGSALSVLVGMHMLRSMKRMDSVSKVVMLGIELLFVVEIIITITNIILLIAKDRMISFLYILPTYIGIFIIATIFYELLRNRKEFPKKIFSLFIASLSILLLVYLYDRLFAMFAPEVYDRLESQIDPFSIGFVLVACIHFVATYLLKSDEILTKIKEINMANINVAQSQIQPHFINNTLYNIKALYQTNPVRAEKMIDNFAGFLSGHKDALAKQGTHPFRQELEHIKCYIDIEKERFENIDAIYDIHAKDFELPPLTLQPLVENSIKYGLRPKRDGGIIGIQTTEDSEKVTIIVRDNGVGFDLSKPADTSRIHVGLENTRFRIEHLCGGKLMVESIIGQGTRVIITIPKGVKA